MTEYNPSIIGVIALIMETEFVSIGCILYFLKTYQYKHLQKIVPDEYEEKVVNHLENPERRKWQWYTMLFIMAITLFIQNITLLIIPIIINTTCAIINLFKEIHAIQNITESINSFVRIKSMYNVFPQMKQTKESVDQNLIVPVSGKFHKLDEAIETLNQKIGQMQKEKHDITFIRKYTNEINKIIPNVTDETVDIVTKTICNIITLMEDKRNKSTSNKNNDVMITCDVLNNILNMEMLNKNITVEQAKAVSAEHNEIKEGK